LTAATNALAAPAPPLGAPLDGGLALPGAPGVLEATAPPPETDGATGLLLPQPTHTIAAAASSGASARRDI
jgi:hypothetical protein